MTYLEQKSLEERAHSDARGFAVVDADKNCIRTASNQDSDGLKRKYEELQVKFYTLV